MAWHYAAPLEEMRFVIEEVLEAPAQWAATPAFRELDAATAAAVLQEAARFASGVLQPINASADRQGCRLEPGPEGGVRTPDGYRAAYRAFVEGGWPALAADPRWGGQGLPLLLDAAMREMLAACNHGWTMYPDLLHGAVEAIDRGASESLKALYLPPLVSGRWLAAMALTEPQAGSDLAPVRTKAVPQADGSLRVSGSKIFISGGDHDLAENIVHLVLCRLPDAPPGSAGLSLALVPKRLPDGSRNALCCEGLEKKMGLAGSATCAMRYEGATGWLVGSPHRGLAALFPMMNSARLHVGLQGLGHLEMATQNALRHAAERRQGRRGRNTPSEAPIEEHPAVRRILLELQARAEASRIVAYRAAQWLDEAAHASDAARRERAGRQAALYTPVVKALLTDQAFHGASRALQVFGGYGYTREFGIEQTLRDARVGMIYEGSNEIQAIDLLQRKVLGRDGEAALQELLDDLLAEASRCEGNAQLADIAAALRAQCASLREATAALRAGHAADPDWPLRAADDYLAAFGHTLLAWGWAAGARAAAAGSDDSRARRKLALARFAADWLLPEAQLRWQRVKRRDLAWPAEV